VEDDQTGYLSFTPFLPGRTWGIALSDCEKVESHADILETQFQPVADPLVPSVIEMFDVVLRSYFLTTCCEPELTNSDEV
jgi:hypothetical protein